MASLDQIRARGERDLDQTLKGLSRRHRKRIRAAIRKYGTLDTIPGTFWQELQKEIENETAVLLLLIFAATHVSTQSVLGFRREPHDVALSGSQFASARAVEFARQYLGTTRERLQAAYEKLRETLAGKPIRPADIAKEVDDILSDDRAERAAVTETTTGISGGQKGGADDYEQDTGVEVKRYWVTERDERVCPICQPLHGTEQATWPPDLSNGPPAHVNCRCHKRLKPIAQPAFRRGAAQEKAMRLVEESFSHPQSVDRSAMVIRGAKIIGVESRNGRTYSDAALDKLTQFYEGQSVNVDHDRSKPNPERKMSDGFGMLRNVQRRADGVYGDLHYLGEHTLAPVILERAERMPESFGLSHSAEGRVVRKKGKLIVEDVEAVHSVDIVREPATTKGLFESEGEFDMELLTIQEIVEATPSETPGFEFLSEQMGAGVVDPTSQVQVAAGTGATDQIKAAFRAAVVEAFDDESLDIKATIARIKQIMTAQEKLDEEKPAPEKEEEQPVEEKQKQVVPESVDEDTARVNLIEAENLLLKADREATPERVKAVAAVDEEDRQALVESWPSKAGHGRPESSPPRHTFDEAFEIPKDTKKFAAWLR